MGETEISWTHRPNTVGRSWNPVQGCRMVSPGCANCYAQRMASRFAENGWSKGLINLTTKKWNGETRLAVHKLGEPFGWREPATVFANSMSDLFYDGFDNMEIAAVFGVMAATPNHTYQILTKRAARMRAWFEWVASNGRASRGDILGYLNTRARSWLPDHHKGHVVGKVGSDWPLPNVWLGVSTENQDTADERIPDLLATPAVVRFLSMEPLIGPIDLEPFMLWSHTCPRCGPGVWAPEGHCNTCGSKATEANGPGWVIAGVESGPGARFCDDDWLRAIRDACKSHEVPFFMKQLVVDGKLRKNVAEFPKDLRIQEFPR